MRNSGNDFGSKLLLFDDIAELTNNGGPVDDRRSVNDRGLDDDGGSFDDRGSVNDGGSVD